MIFLTFFMANIIGIDLGTSTTLLARFNDSGSVESIVNVDGDTVTPSVIQIEPDGQVIYGKEAKKWLGLGKDNVFSEFKREMGSFTTWEVDGRKYTPEDLSAILLKSISTEYIAQHGKPDTIVISWPANFTDRQKVSTQEAARRAGLKVVDFINEPTAAALYYAHSIKKNGKFLVYDMGGGTFDISLVEVDGFNVKVIFSEGVDRLGGADMDKAVLEIISNKFKEQTRGSFDREDCSFTQLDIEEPKHSLSTREITYIRLVSNLHGPQKISLMRAEFEAAISPIVKKAESACLEMLKTNQIDIKSITEIFMVGGPSRIPALQASVEKILGRKPMIREPDHAVARGAAIYAAIKTDKSILTNLQKNVIGAVKVTEITPHYFGIALHKPDSEVEMFNRVLIDKGLPVPYSTVKKFIITESEACHGIQLIITQGRKSEPDLKKVNILHDKYIKLGLGARAGQQIEVTFSYDINGVMKCTLLETSTLTRTVVNLQAD